MKKIFLAGLLAAQIVFLSHRLLEEKTEARNEFSMHVEVAERSHNGVKLQQLSDFERAFESGVPVSETPTSIGKPRKGRLKTVPASVKLDEGLSTPEYLRTEWHRRAVVTWIDYSLFFSENNIAHDKIPRIVDLITDANSSAAVAKSFARVNNEAGNVIFSSEVDAHDQLEKELGPDLYAKLNAFTASLPLRRQLGVFSDMLKSNSLTLAAAQLQQLLSAMSDPTLIKDASGHFEGSALDNKASQFLSEKQLKIFRLMINAGSLSNF